MIRMKEVYWPEEMKIYFEQVMRMVPNSMGTLQSSEILRGVEEHTRERGDIKVSEEDLAKAVLDKTPIFYRSDIKKLLCDLGIGKETLNKPKGQDTFGKLTSDIIKAASVAGVSANEGLIRNILNVYSKNFSGVRTSILFSTTTKRIEHRELDVRYIDKYTPHNPHKMAIDHNLLPRENHPLEMLMEEISSSFPIMGYSMKFGVMTGVKCITALFAEHLPQKTEKVYALKNIPESVKSSKAFFNKYRADKVRSIGVDFSEKTVSLNFKTDQIGDITTVLTAEMLKDLEFDLPKKELLRLCNKAETLKLTYNWSISRVQKITFDVYPLSVEDIPKNLNMTIEHYIKKAPFKTARKKYIYSITFTRKGQYLTIDNDYSGVVMEY